MESYKPLPEGVTLNHSDIHGLGIFAAKDIKKDEVVGISHVSDYSGNFHCDLIRTPLGAFLNHSEENNALLDKKDNYWYLVATSDIESGQEIVINYHNHQCGVYVTNFL